MLAQGRSLSGGQGRGLTLGVETAVDAFLDTFVAGGDLTRTRAVFHELGRTEHREGHHIDALRSVLTVGARAIWSAVSDPAADLDRADLSAVAHALFGYVDVLAGAAAEGYLDEQQDAAHDWALVRRRLITLLVQPDPPADTALHAAAEAARWPLPAAVTVVSVEGTDAEHLARAVGGGAIATVIDGATSIVVPSPGRLPDAPAAAGPAAVARGLTGRRAAVGPELELRRARTSHRLSRRALQLQQAGTLPDGVIGCDEHLVTLLTAWEPGVADRLAARALAPLAAATPASREVLAETLLAWLRCQGQVIATAEALHTHPQTVRYRLRKLRDAYGARLDDPDERLALHLGLLGPAGHRTAKTARPSGVSS
ncbi:helix-turn-helix domain-containing protein [Dactylosporangium aurantiacum]|uniref:Helix-turn-helix domain-containing protein n=1 Tax=Dactylosporangium aurantiacum TaxID=35754 RepID=A0A9Q9MLS9_9ACTN|nr:helix-turn-helix domain-containing protein [Dactylosporangium aurantiacum]MDG6109968.1 helix-turn-helix domain-containing protein [Dactylosporangium aurantiacum]UWZ57281.1 helix-turn-helix domain-containing protein [Dactylosporangium aurantiacum]